MTLEEKIIVSVFTNTHMLYDFTLIHKDVEKRLGRSFTPEELAKMREELKELYRPDFMKLVNNQPL